MSSVGKEYQLQTAEGAVESVPAPRDDNPANVDSRGRLPAEVKFDKAVYGGISYFAQAATGIVLLHWIRHGSGRPIFDAVANWFGPKVLSKITSKKGADAVKEADHWIVVSGMIMVGNTFLLPVKWLEDRKPHFVREINDSSNARREARGETISPEELDAQQHHLALLEKAPKQTWGSLLGGRAFGLGAVYATLYGVGQENNKAMEKIFARSVSKGVDAIGLKKAAKSATLRNYMLITFDDLFYSTISAGGLYVYSHFIAPPKKKRGEEAADQIVVPPQEEPVLEEIDPKAYSSHPKPKNIRAAGWKQTQQPALQSQPQQNLAHVESITPSGGIQPAEVAP